MDEPKIDALSADAAAMADYFKSIDAILGGIKTMRAAGREYLPKFRDETGEAYDERLSLSRMTNIFSDIVENLAQRPFSEPVVVSEESVSPEIAELCKNIDGSGSSLHKFAGETFFNAIAYSVEWILVDYPKGLGPKATRAQEKQAGLRPYWARYAATDLLEAKTAMIGGKEEFVCVRLVEEPSPEGNRRVRKLCRDELGGGAYGPARWELWQHDPEATAKGAEWRLDGEGEISIGVIPLVPVLTGRRKGKTWKTTPPMQAAAELQVELYQEESNLKSASTQTAFPMLAGNGVEPEMDDNDKPVKLGTGPGVVLYGGEGGSWQVVEPSAASLQFLANQIDRSKKDLRELGRQPLTAQSGNLTVITTAVAAEKGNSAVQAWAMNLKESLERCIAFTALWLKQADAEPVVHVTKDFDHSWDDTDSFGHVLTLRKNNEISREAVIHEAKRRRVLDKDYDPEADLEAMLDEIEDDDDDDDEIQGPPNDAEPDEIPPGDDGE